MNSFEMDELIKKPENSNFQERRQIVVFIIHNILNLNDLDKYLRVEKIETLIDLINVEIGACQWML
jgi:hypothetical protein